ncbi:MAG TPA: isoprenylcysteine carboxylmethyltransferase family protein [Myxococcaceae bacterium]|jgi:protein-S-isoprenylcysteine O-methyltransferase Ste14
MRSFGAALAQALVLCGLAAVFAPVDGPVYALAVLSAALVAGETALAPEPSLPTAATHRAPGWAGPAVATGAGLLALQAAAVLVRWSVPPEVWSAGAALMLMGGGLRLWAIHALGASFRTEHEVHEGQRLVRSGPYAFLRHPSELGLLIFALGAAALTGSWPAAAIWVLVLLPSSLLRLRREEAMLRAAFGPGYTA